MAAMMADLSLSSIEHNSRLSAQFNTLNHVDSFACNCILRQKHVPINPKVCILIASFVISSIQLLILIIVSSSATNTKRPVDRWIYFQSFFHRGKASRCTLSASTWATSCCNSCFLSVWSSLVHTQSTLFFESCTHVRRFFGGGSRPPSPAPMAAIPHFACTVGVHMHLCSCLFMLHCNVTVALSGC